MYSFLLYAVSVAAIPLGLIMMSGTPACPYAYVGGVVYLLWLYRRVRGAASDETTGAVVRQAKRHLNRGGR